MPQVQSGSPDAGGLSGTFLLELLRRRWSARDLMGDNSLYARGASNRDERHRSGDAESVPFTAMENFADTTSHQANITKNSTAQAAKRSAKIQQAKRRQPGSETLWIA